MNKTLFTLGLLLVMLDAALLIFGIIPFGIAGAAGVLGIGLIFLSRRRKQVASESKPGAKVVQTIHSTDGQLRAVIKQRVDGKYQVEIWKLVTDYSQDFGPGSQWTLQRPWGITDTLSSAVDLAASYIGAGA
jgi:uncharacterized SAM-binding protein YcdF (DUF218 family)